MPYYANEYLLYAGNCAGIYSMIMIIISFVEFFGVKLVLF